MRALAASLISSWLDSSGIQLSGEAIIEVSHFSKPAGVRGRVEGPSKVGGGAAKWWRMVRRVVAGGWVYKGGRSSTCLRMRVSVVPGGGSLWICGYGL
jgi:hypothetical protein